MTLLTQLALGQGECQFCYRFSSQSSQRNNASFPQSRKNIHAKKPHEEQSGQHSSFFVFVCLN